MENEISRMEHIEWCKKRALEYIDSGDTNQAFMSMVSDLKKHSETKNHIGMELGTALLFIGQLNTPDEMRNFINGFN